MADYSCEWCDKESICKYAYDSTECIPRQQIDITKVISRIEINSYEGLIKSFEDREPEIFINVIQAYKRLIWDYPSEEELRYAKEILGE